MSWLIIFSKFITGRRSFSAYLEEISCTCSFSLFDLLYYYFSSSEAILALLSCQLSVLFVFIKSPVSFSELSSIVCSIILTNTFFLYFLSIFFILYYLNHVRMSVPSINRRVLKSFVVLLDTPTCKAKQNSIELPVKRFMKRVEKAIVLATKQN